MSAGQLIGVGVGPGDPELITVKGVRALKEADAVFVPVSDEGEPGRAESVVAAHVDPESITRLRFSLSFDEKARERDWDEAGRRVSAVVADGGTAAFATIGDPNVYSTFTYLAATVTNAVPGTVVTTVPGITAMQDLASRVGTPLVEGTERLALVPFTAGDEQLELALASFDTVVAYKGGRHLDRVLDVIDKAGRLEQAVFGARLGLDGERVGEAKDQSGEPAPYLSTVIVTATRDGRGSKL